MSRHFNDGITAEHTLMMTRFCLLEDGSSIADAWTFISGIADNFCEAGNNTMKQMVARTIGLASNKL